MKGLKRSKWTLGLLVLLTVSLAGGSVFAEDQAIGRQDYEKLVKEGFANADGTRKIVAKVLANLDKEMEAADGSDMLQDEVKDAKYWNKRANKLLDQCKKQMNAKKYDKALVLDVNQAWQYYLKAGSAAVRASMMP